MSAGVAVDRCTSTATTLALLPLASRDFGNGPASTKAVSAAPLGSPSALVPCPALAARLLRSSSVTVLVPLLFTKAAAPSAPSRRSLNAARLAGVAENFLRKNTVVRAQL